MKRRLLAVGAVFWAVTLAAGQPQGAPRIEEKAEKHLKAMSSYLANLKTFAFQAEESFDVVQEDGEQIQYGNQRKVIVQRPNKVFGEAQGDTANSRFSYDGKTVTIFDPKHKTYATEKAPGSIGPMLDHLHEQLGTQQPLADFLYADPYKIFTEHVQSGRYVGLHHVGKVKCHHLAFRQRVLDWQIWIEAGAKPLPRKLVITFKRQAGEPQYTAVIHRWDINPKVSAATFQFEPPAGATKIEFLKRHGKPAPKKAGK